MKRLNAIAVSLSLMVTPAIAVDEFYAKVMNNLAHELVYCASYFEIVAIAMSNSNAPTLEKKYHDASERALTLAIEMTEEAGLLAATVGSRYLLAAKEMAERIDNNTSNISILTVEYLDPCIELLTNPSDRIKELVGGFQSK